jgi:hypothetical protein
VPVPVPVPAGSVSAPMLMLRSARDGKQKETCRALEGIAHACRLPSLWLLLFLSLWASLRGGYRPSLSCGRS